MRIAWRARSFAFEAGAEILTAAYQLEANGRDVVHLHTGEPDFPTPANIVAAAERAIRDGHTHYTPPGGMLRARTAVADHILRTRGQHVLPQQVILTSGSTQGLMFAMLALVDAGGEVILPDPLYPIFSALVQVAGGDVVTVPLREDLDYRLDLDQLRASVNSRTRLLVINSPHNPTGGILPMADLQAIAELAERHDFAVLSDEVYGDLVYGEERAPSIVSVPGMAERTIVLDSLSKSYAMCGWRLGFVVAPLPLARRLEALMIAGGLCAPSFTQVAAVEALDSPASAATVASMRAEFRRRRDVMVEGLNRIAGFHCPRPPGAFYCFPDIRETGLTDDELAHRLLFEGGVAVLPGNSFGAGGAGHLRLSYAASMDRIQEALIRIAGVVSPVAATV